MAVEADTIRRAEERVGSLLNGKYRLERVLGIGGMAVVYAATHRNQKQFAVKVLHAELSIREGIRARFLREGYAANSVKHSGAVAVMDDDVAKDGAAFLVMELLEGSSVEELWTKHDRKLPLGCALAIGHDLLDVLAAAHAKGIVHRDIKPANLFLTHEGRLKVLDFGIARVRDIAASSAEGTGTGMLLGTPAFMAPEQAIAKASAIDAQTDVWAVGATLFALLGGEFVHTGDNAAEILVKAATTHARSVAILSPDLPAPVVDVIDRALAFHKSERWRNAIAMRDAIREAHLGVFGRIVSRDSLLPMARGDDPRSDPSQRSEIPTTMPAPVIVPAPRPQIAPPLPADVTSEGPDRLGTWQRTLSLAEDSGLRAGEATPMQEGGAPGTTSQAVSSARKPPPSSRTPRRKRDIVALAIIAILAVGGGSTFFVRSLSPGAPVAMPLASTLPIERSPASSSTKESPPTIPQSIVRLTMDPLPSNVTGPPVANAVDAGRAIPSINVSQRKPTTDRPAAARPLHAVATPVAAPSVKTSKPAPASAASASDCNPNYVYDSDGNKVFKSECFLPRKAPANGF